MFHLIFYRYLSIHGYRSSCSIFHGTEDYEFLCLVSHYIIHRVYKQNPMQYPLTHFEMLRTIHPCNLKQEKWAKLWIVLYQYMLKNTRYVNINVTHENISAGLGKFSRLMDVLSNCSSQVFPLVFCGCLPVS